MLRPCSCSSSIHRHLVGHNTAYCVIFSLDPFSRGSLVRNTCDRRLFKQNQPDVGAKSRSRLGNFSVYQIIPTWLTMNRVLKGSRMKLFRDYRLQR